MLARAVILTAEGGQGKSQRIVRLVDQLFDAVGGGKRSDHNGTVIVYDTLHRHGGYRDQGELKGHRNAQTDDLAAHLHREGKILFLQTEVRVDPPCVYTAGKGRDELRDDGGEGCAAYAHIEKVYENDIQDHIDDGGDDQEIQRRSGIAQSPEHRGKIVIQGNKEQSEAHIADIHDRIGKDLFGSV